MDACRNCGAQTLKDLGFIGEIAPFFLKRVLNLECGMAPSAHPVKRFLRRMPFLSRAAQKIYGRSTLLELQICETCSFIQTTVPFPDEAIGKLYADYRTDSYNRERIHYEPEYALIAPSVGSSQQEIQARTEGLTHWLRGKLSLDRDFSMLDYGGADGKFLPHFPGRKYVFDISPVAPADGIVKIKNESDLGSYSYIQLAHVLEHVSFPLEITRKAARLLNDSGHLYIEVPQELDDDTMRRLNGGGIGITIDIHEHINKYCQKSVLHLLRTAGLEPLEIQSEEVNFGWANAIIIRALARKSR